MTTRPPKPAEIVVGEELPPFELNVTSTVIVAGATPSVLAMSSRVGWIDWLWHHTSMAPACTRATAQAGPIDACARNGRE